MKTSVHNLLLGAGFNAGVVNEKGEVLPFGRKVVNMKIYMAAAIKENYLLSHRN